MKFRDGDSLLTMDVVRENAQVFVVTEGGFAKRSNVDDYRVQGRAGLGIKAVKITEARGELVGALITEPGEEVLVIMESGKVMRSSVDEVSVTGRNTQGVTFTRPEEGDKIIAIARNVEKELEDVAEEADAKAAIADSDGSENSETSPNSAEGTIELSSENEENHTEVPENPEA